MTEIIATPSDVTRALCEGAYPFAECSYPNCRCSSIRSDARSFQHALLDHGWKIVRVMKKPKFVTFTGLDMHTDLERVKALSAQYPIEWGILFGGSGPRYPSLEFVYHVATLPDLQLSAHFCGDYAKKAMEGVIETNIRRFNRLQINSGRYDLHALKALQENIQKPIVIQTRAKEFALPGVMGNISLLHDQSGGRGLVPESRPIQHLGMSMVGYAGGIGPHNIFETLSQIDAFDFWLDMETNIRTNDWLDLDKCELVCKAIWER